MRFTVERNKWFRGKGSYESKLLNNDGYMCCLGFFSLACGLKEADIVNKTCPSDLPEELVLSTDLNKLVEPNMYNNSHCLKLMITNDLETFDNEDMREAELAIHFAEIGVEVEFV